MYVSQDTTCHNLALSTKEIWLSPIPGLKENAKSQVFLHLKGKCVLCLLVNFPMINCRSITGVSFTSMSVAKDDLGFYLRRVAMT